MRQENNQDNNIVNFTSPLATGKPAHPVSHQGGEIFIKDIQGFEGLYKIDKDGNIYSNLKIKKHSFSKSTGYMVTQLYKNNKQKLVYIHRLIAIAFISNPENKKCINHKNGNKTDNRIENLEWCSYSENNYHAFRVLKRKASLKGYLGEKSPFSKTINQLSLDGKIINVFHGIREAGRKTNIQYKEISACCRNVQKTAHGFIWRYVND